MKNDLLKILDYRKSVFWIILAALVVCIVVVVLVTNPKKSNAKDDKAQDGSSRLAGNVPTVGIIPKENWPEVKTWRLWKRDGAGSQDKLTIDEFPGEEFSIVDDSPGFTVTSAKGTRVIMDYFPSYHFDAFLCDLNGDGKPEFCLNAEYGSGWIDERVYVYEHTTGKTYVLMERGKYNYWIKCKDGKLVICRQPEVHVGEEPEYGTIVYQDGKYKYVSEYGLNTVDLLLYSTMPDLTSYLWEGKDVSETLFEVIKGRYNYHIEGGSSFTLGADGQFEGVYSNYGYVGSDGKTVNLVCNYSGRLGNAKKLDENVYSVQVLELKYEEPGKEYTENDLLYRTAGPRGLEDCKELIVYLPGCDRAKVKEEAVRSFELFIENDRLFYDNRLTIYGIYNVTNDPGSDQEQGFVCYEVTE